MTTCSGACLPHCYNRNILLTFIIGLFLGILLSKKLFKKKSSQSRN